MVVKGIITAIDILTNKCTVELPIFKTVGSDDISAEAIFAIPPGTYNGYDVGDIVIVDFENNKMSKPVILGKLYTNTTAESNSKGALLCNSLSVSNSASLPGNTQLIFKDDLLNTYSKYTSIVDIINAIESAPAIQQANKFITMRYYRKLGVLRVYLHGFTAVDAGGKVYLLKTKRRSHKASTDYGGYSHPANLVKQDKQGILGLGFGTVAETIISRGYAQDKFPKVPSWMPNAGLVQTEWVITESMITKGYFEINIKHDWLSMLCCLSTNTEVWSKVIGSGKNGLKTRNCGAMKIKLAYKPLTSSSFSTITPETLYFGIQAGSSETENHYKLDDKDGKYYLTGMHISIK